MARLPRYPVIIVDIFLNAVSYMCENVISLMSTLCIFSYLCCVLMCSAQVCSAELAASEVGWSSEGMD